jgi:hypothetical protein
LSGAGRPDTPLCGGKPEMPGSRNQITFIISAIPMDSKGKQGFSRRIDPIPRIKERREEFSSLLKQAFVSYFAATDLTTLTSRPL